MLSFVNRDRPIVWRPINIDRIYAIILALLIGTLMTKILARSAGIYNYKESNCWSY